MQILKLKIMQKRDSLQKEKSRCSNPTTSQRKQFISENHRLDSPGLDMSGRHRQRHRPDQSMKTADFLWTHQHETRKTRRLER